MQGFEYLVREKNDDRKVVRKKRVKCDEFE